VPTLTARGWGFIATGAGLYLMGRVTGSAELYTLALAAVVLPLLAMASVRSGRYKITSTRSLNPSRTFPGTDATASIRLTNSGSLATAPLLIEDMCPFASHSGSARFVLEGIGIHQTETIAYSFPCRHRGRFRLGPLRVRINDPFGLAGIQRSFHSASELVVYPHVEPLPATTVGGGWGGASTSRVRRINFAGEDYYTVRDYREGDDLRKIHWRSTAHTGNLMVRQEETARQSHATVLLDLRRHAHTGAGPESSLEWTISAGASFCVALARAGFQIRLVTDDGTETSPGADRDQVEACLETLAAVTSSEQLNLLPVLDRLSRGPSGGLLVAVVAPPSPEEAGALVRTRACFDTALALMVLPASFSPGATRSAREEREKAPNSKFLMERAGWRLVAGGKSDRLAELWSRLTAQRPHPSQNAPR